MSNKKILVGDKRSHTSLSLCDFENLSEHLWSPVKQDCQIPEGFMFLAGVLKYSRRRAGAHLKFGKDHFFVQSFLPHNGNGVCRTRDYGALYALYQPEKLEKDDVVLSESAVYLAMPDDRIQLILANGENRQALSVNKMFSFICKQRGLQDFSPTDTLPGFYQVTFKKKSCGYFLKDRSYVVWAKPIGIPDIQSGEIHKGWLFCDINCGIPAIVKDDREDFVPLDGTEGKKIGLFTVSNHNLVFETL